MKVMRYIGLVALVATVLSSVPMAAQATTRPHAAPAASGQQLVHVRVALSAFQDVQSIWVGIAKGFYQREGIQLDIQNTDWGGANQLMVGGHADLSTSSDGDIVAQNAQGNDTTLAFPLFYFAGGALMYNPLHFPAWKHFDYFMRVTHGNRKEAMRLALLQIKGHKAGMQFSDYSTYVGMIKYAGLNVKDFPVIDMNQEDLPPAALSGSIDIMLGGIPQRLTVLKQGFVALVDQTALPSTVVHAGFGAHRSWIKSHMALAAKIEKAILETLAFIKAHPQEAFPIISSHLREAGTVESAQDMARVWNVMEYFPDSKQWYEQQVANPHGQFYWKDRFQLVVSGLKAAGKLQKFNVPLDDLDYGLKVVSAIH